MPERPPHHVADELPRSAASDPPLSVGARTPGPRGLAPKLGLAILALLILFAMVAGLWAASHFSPKRTPSKPPVATQG